MKFYLPDNKGSRPGECGSWVRVTIRGRQPPRGVNSFQTEVEHMTKRVAEVFIETLVNAGVKRVYGVAGDSLNGLTDTIRKSKDIQWMHVRHEEVAAFAAGAGAHLTGELA